MHNKVTSHWLLAHLSYDKISMKRHINVTLSQTTGDNVKFEKKNGRKLSKWVEKTGGKKRNCSLRAISPFPTVVSKDIYSRHVKTWACLGN